MATTIIPTMPDTWCLTIDSYKASYEGNKIYLGEQNNLERHTYVTVSITFQTLAKQREFFVWWQNETQSGGIPFFAKLPLFAKEDYYLMAQNKPFTQSVDTGYKITASFMIYSNRTKGQVAPPTAYDVDGVVEESSSNNIIMLNGIDPEGDKLTYEMVGSHAGVTIKGDSIIYTPPAGFKGTKTFKYKVFDGVLYSNEATVTILVKEINAPVAYDMTVTAAKNIGLDNERYIQLKGTDDKGKPLTFSIVDKGTTDSATIINTDKNMTKVFISNGSTQVAFTYKVNNGVKDSNVATCTINLVDPVIPAIPLPDNIIIPATCQADFEMVIYNPAVMAYDEINKTELKLNVSTSQGKPASISSVVLSDNVKPFAPSSDLVSQKLTIKTSGTNIGGVFTVVVALNYGAGHIQKTITVTVDDTSSNGHYAMNASTAKYYIPKDAAVPYHVGVNTIVSTIHPNQSDYPEVLNTFVKDALLGGYSNPFSKYTIKTHVNPSEGTDSITDDGVLLITPTDTTADTFSITCVLEVSNDDGSKKEIAITAYR